jgi:hypothetical protein
MTNDQIYININQYQYYTHIPPTDQYKKYTVMPCASVLSETTNLAL